MRRLTFGVMREFNTFNDDTHMGPEMKTIQNVKKKIEENMFRLNIGEGQKDNRYSNVTPSTRMTKEEEKYFLECFHELLIQGIIMWGRAGEPQAFHDYFSITSYGKSVLNEGEITPHEPQGYFVNIKSKIPSLNDLALFYLQECVYCFNNRNLIAASILLGIASEIIFYQLFDVFKNSKLINEKTRNKCELLSERISIKRKFDIVSDELHNIKGKLGPEIGENLDIGLEGIFHLIRLQRNESGHPSGFAGKTEVDKEFMHARLIVFIMYCKMVYNIIDKLK